MTSIDMLGASVSLLKMDDELKVFEEDDLRELLAEREKEEEWLE